MLTCLKIHVQNRKNVKKKPKKQNNKKTHQHQHLNHIKKQQKTFVKIFLPIINFNWLFN